MKTYPHLVVCTHCDSVYQHRALNVGEIARCERCQAILYRSGRLNTEYMLALTLTAAVTFVMANVYPVISVSFHSVQQSATVWQAALALANGTTFPLAVCTLFLLIVAPFLQITLYGWIVFFARNGQCAPGFISLMKVLTWLRPWSMIEIGMLGFLVAAIKLSGFLQVIPGPGCWAMLVLMLFIILINNQDPRSLWMLVPDRHQSKAAHHG